MKVLKKGREQTGWAEEANCSGKGNGGGGCYARLLVEEGDLFVTARGYYDGTSDYFITFKCPECGVLTDIVVPSGLEHQLVQRYTRRKSANTYARRRGSDG